MSTRRIARSSCRADSLTNPKPLVEAQKKTARCRRSAPVGSSRVTGAEEDCIVYKLAEGDCTVFKPADSDSVQKKAAIDDWRRRPVGPLVTIDDWCIEVLLVGGRRF